MTHIISSEGSVEVTYDSFLNAFLTKPISCEDIQTDTKHFLTDGSASWYVIMDRINADFRSQVSGESMWTDDALSSRAQP